MFQLNYRNANLSLLIILVNYNINYIITKMNRTVGKVIDIASEKGVVRSGAHLWVSKLLHQRGPLSSTKIWEEFIKDSSVEKDLIKSKHFLKDRILHQMHAQGKLVKGKAIDMPRFNHGGWELVPHKAFKNVAPDILVNLQPLPAVNREDYKTYLRDNNIPFEF